MAYPNGMGDRSLLYRKPTSPRDENVFPTYAANPLSPQRNPNRLSGSHQSASELRGSLQRRFTTNALPTLSPIGQQRRQAAEMNPQVQAYSRITPSEHKSRQYEQLLAQQRRIQEQMNMIDAETRAQVDEHRLLEEDVNRFIASQSEPTTPPEYESFSSTIARPNRYSSASLTSPPGINNRQNRSGSQLTSPPANSSRPYSMSNATTHLPSKSMPGSTRNSDEESDEEKEYLYGFAESVHRAAANPNRNSMPVTGYQHSVVPDMSSVLGPVNTTSFLFGDDDKPIQKNNASPDAKSYLQLHATEDKFPILVRREGNGDMSLSASSAALDLALSQSPGPEAQQAATDRVTAARHRISLPPSAYRPNGIMTNDIGMAQLNGILADASTGKPAAINRRSQEVKFSGIGETTRPGLSLASPPRGMANGIPMSQSSYSTNDLPTLKSINHGGVNGISINSPPVQAQASGIASPEQNSLSLSRVTSGTMNTSNGNNRQSQGFATKEIEEELHNAFQTPLSILQANAAPFGPTSSTLDYHSAQGFTSSMISPFAQPPAFYGGYGMQMLDNRFNNMNVGTNNANVAGGYGSQQQWPSQMPMYQQQQGSSNGYRQYRQQGQSQGQATAGAGRYSDSQSRVVQQRRTHNVDEAARYADIKLETLAGEIYTLCKDQHGCRFLQKKLEERDPQQVQLIFNETNQHVIELMTDPFGNYLCQKLLENTNDEQRTVIIANASPQMVRIALNQHGTRALQKMIEFVTTRPQIEIITEALRDEVVQLIQDLNGNHVVQKCLNHLTPEDAQFIFDAVSANCVSVGTHRHGCCVLQRCIDHAAGDQKTMLVMSITNNAFSLVQDPFGNYVVQYILDLNEPMYTRPLCLAFTGSVVYLSKQKFSSNVVEKVIRCAKDADEEVQRVLIEEMLLPVELEKMLRDSYANYVVQTAMDHCAIPETRAILIESIRPVLPSIRHTPYGRRIAGKIQDYDTRIGIAPSGNATPYDSSSPGQASLSGHATPHSRGGLSSGFTSPPSGGYGTSHFTPNNHIASPTPQRHSGTYAMLNGGQTYQNHGFGRAPFSPMGRNNHPNAYGGQF